jgi:tetratricopeptide (TPR) repeat protein
MIRTRFLRSSLVTLTALAAPVLSPLDALAADPPAATAAPAPADPAAAPAEGDAAQAASDPSKVEARQRYDRGIRLYAEGEFALAVIEFERAYTLVPDYRVLYNIGQVRIQLAQYARAKKALDQYLAEGGDQVAPERKASVQADLEMLASRTATLEIKSNVPDAEVVVNDSIVGKTPLAEPVLLDAGEHRITLRKPGYSSKFSQITLAGRDAESLQLDLEKVPDAKVSQVIIEKSAPEKSNRSTWLWATWSATGVFAIGAGITGGLGIKAANDLEELQSDPSATRAKLDSQQSRAKTLLIAADVLGAAAVISGGTAIYLTLSGPKKEEKPVATGHGAKKASVGVLLRPDFIGLRGTY